MGLFEAVIPAKHRKAFTRAVAAQRVMNEKGKSATIAQANAYYRAINALPLTLQALAKKRAAALDKKG